MLTTTRRALLQAALGGGALAAVTPSAQLGLLFLRTKDDELLFGELEPLVSLMQGTPAAELQELLVEKLRKGVDLSTLVAAGALANARAFGGHDYTGYHVMMAWMPAYRMSMELPEKSRALPVLKVLYRNASRIQERGGRAAEALHRVPTEPQGDPDPRTLKEAVLDRDVKAAESAFAALCEQGARAAYDELQLVLQENLDVHRVVLAWRAWETLELTGQEHAHTLLRQPVRFCIDAESHRVQQGRPELLRTYLPELLEKHRLTEGLSSTKSADDASIEALADRIFRSEKSEAASAMAEALGKGLSAADAGEAISLAANRLLLNDPGRSESSSSKDKPAGSVHRASVGVHACDAARAWRNIAGVCSPRNAAASLIAGAFHTAGQSSHVGERPFPYDQHLGDLQGLDARALLSALKESIEQGDQSRACALAHRYGEIESSEGPLFNLLLDYAISQDGALHAEKYYWTAREEFTSARASFRWRHAVSLARVTASEFGFPAPGYAEARELLGS